MFSIIQVGKKDLNHQTIDRLCSILIPAFVESEVGSICDAFGFKHFWDCMFQGEPPAALFLLKDEEETVGLIGGITFTDPLTRLLYASEVVWCVDPKARGCGWGMKLLQAFEWWAKTCGCSRIVLHNSAKTEARFSKRVSPIGYLPYQVEYLKIVPEEM